MQKFLGYRPQRFIAALSAAPLRVARTAPPQPLDLESRESSATRSLWRSFPSWLQPLGAPSRGGADISRKP